MYIFRNTILSFFFILILTACSSQQPLSEEKKTKLQTAKVNVQLGIAYLERNDVVRAKQKLLQAMDQAPDIPETWYAMAYFLEATGNKELAGRYYVKAVAIAPKRGDVLNNYGTYLCRVGRYKKAIEQFLTATKDRGYLNSADAYENAGLCARKIPNDDLANTYLNKSLDEDPQRPSVLIELADIHFQAQKYKKAQLFLAQFLALSSPTQQSVKLGEALNKKMNPPAVIVASKTTDKPDKLEKAEKTEKEKLLPKTSTHQLASKNSHKMKHRKVYAHHKAKSKQLALNDKAEKIEKKEKVKHIVEA